MATEALLIIDMSNDFVADAGSLTAGAAAQEIVPYIVNLARDMHGQGQPIAICMDTHQVNDAHFTEWPPHNVAGSWGHALYGALQIWHREVEADAHVIYVEKTSYNAFYGTNLAQALRRRGVDTVHITGVCTDICDFLTAAGAYDEGFQTVVHRRGCATFTGNHDVFIDQMATCFHTTIVD